MATAIVNWLKRDIKNNNTPLLIFCGRQRSGKTAFAMRVAWEVYGDKFSFDNVVNTIEDFAKLMKTKKNTCIILDEATVSLYVYDWNSFLHKIFTIIQDSQAYKHNMVIVVLPMVSHLTSQQKEMADAVVEMKKIKVWDDKQHKFVAKYFYKYMKQHQQYSNMNKRKIFMSTIVETCGPVPLPPDHIWLPYLQKGQSEFKENILDEQLAEIAKRKTAKIKTKPVI